MGHRTSARVGSEVILKKCLRNVTPDLDKWGHARRSLPLDGALARGGRPFPHEARRIYTSVRGDHLEVKVDCSQRRPRRIRHEGGSAAHELATWDGSAVAERFYLLTLDYVSAD